MREEVGKDEGKEMEGREGNAVCIFKFFLRITHDLSCHGCE